MGQFKPMVKMYTTEPSVELKLKKGGHVSMKHDKKHGHKMMDGGVMSGLAAAPAPTRMQMGQGTLPGRAPARPSMAARRKAMMARPMMKEGGESKAEHAAEMKKMMGTEAKLKKHASMPASKAHKGLKGGGSANAYANTMMHTAHPDKVKGKTGEVKEGAIAGYATGGAIPSETTSGTPKTTMMHQAKKDKAHGTGGVRMGNAGGFKKGGKAKKMAGGGAYCADGGDIKAKKMMGGGMAYAMGGGVKGMGVVNNVSTSKPGVTNTTTGEVKEANAGGYKKGGAPKKQYATGGLVDSGKPVAYPKKPASQPVANTIQSGTFKKGGKVKFNDGGAAGPMSNYEKGKKTMPPVKDPEAIAAKASRELEDAFNPIGIFKELGSKLRDKLRGQGAVTETEKSVTVSPPQAKKRAGGAC